MNDQDRIRETLRKADEQRAPDPRIAARLAEASKMLQAKIDAGGLPANLARAQLTLLSHGIGVEEPEQQQGLDLEGLSVEALDEVCSRSAGMAMRLREERGEDMSAYKEGSDEN